MIPPPKPVKGKEEKEETVFCPLLLAKERASEVCSTAAKYHPRKYVVRASAVADVEAGNNGNERRGGNVVIQIVDAREEAPNNATPPCAPTAKKRPKRTGTTTQEATMDVSERT